MIGSCLVSDYNRGKLENPRRRDVISAYFVDIGTGIAVISKTGINTWVHLSAWGR